MVKIPLQHKTQIAPVQQERKRKWVETKSFNWKCIIWLKKYVSAAALWAQVKLMKRRFPAYMCDSLGDSNQAGVHFLGIGSQLRGADVPRVIKCSQPVINCPSAITANVPGQKKKALVKLKGGESRVFCPLCTDHGAHGMSGTCMQAWVTEQIPAMLLASRGDNTMCQAGFFTQTSCLKNQGIPGHHFLSLCSLEKQRLLSLSNGQNDTVWSSLSLFILSLFPWRCSFPFFVCFFVCSLSVWACRIDSGEARAANLTALFQ